MILDSSRSHIKLGVKPFLMEGGIVMKKKTTSRGTSMGWATTDGTQVGIPGVAEDNKSEPKDADDSLKTDGSVTSKKTTRTPKPNPKYCGLEWQPK